MDEFKGTPGPYRNMATNANIDDDEGEQRINTWVGIGNPEMTDGMVAIAVFDGRHDDPEFDANVALLTASFDLLNDGSLVADFLDLALNCWVEGRDLSDDEGRAATAALMQFNRTSARALGTAPQAGEGVERG